MTEEERNTILWKGVPQVYKELILKGNLNPVPNKEYAVYLENKECIMRLDEEELKTKQREWLAQRKRGQGGSTS